MGNYTILGGFENPRRGRQERNLTTNVPKILDLKSSSEQIFSKNCRWVPLIFSRDEELIESVQEKENPNTKRKITNSDLLGSTSLHELSPQVLTTTFRNSSFK